MQSQPLSFIYRIVDACSSGRCRGCRYNDGMIVSVLLWAAHHNRPLCWAAQLRHWPALLRHELPSASTLSRRLRTGRVGKLLSRIFLLLAGLFIGLRQRCGRLLSVASVDSFPMAVGNYSKDRHAKRGRGAGAMFRGYKLHAVVVDHVFCDFAVLAAHTNDQVPAARLLGRCPLHGYVLGDNQYDANPVHRQLSDPLHLLAPARKSNQHVRDKRRNSSQRLRALELLHPPGQGTGFGPRLFRCRSQIERAFGRLSMAGLSRLPHWVRTMPRVQRWVAAKLILDLIGCAQRQRLTC